MKLAVGVVDGKQHCYGSVVVAGPSQLVAQGEYVDWRYRGHAAHCLRTAPRRDAVAPHPATDHVVELRKVGLHTKEFAVSNVLLDGGIKRLAYSLELALEADEFAGFPT